MTDVVVRESAAERLNLFLFPNSSSDSKFDAPVDEC